MSITRRSPFKNVFDFFVYSNIFIACCTTLMLWQTYHLMLGLQPELTVCGFVFFATICSYSFHWYLTSHSVIPSQRVIWLRKYKNLHLILFFIGIIGSAIFFFLLLPYWPWLLLCAVITFFYSAPKIPHRYFRALRKVAIGKTLFLAGVWTYVTTVLPILISYGRWRADIVLFILSRFFLIYAICILFDYRDRPDDKIAGIRSIITYLDEKGINILFTITLFLYIVSTLLMLRFNYSLLSVIFLLLPALILGFLFDYAKINFSDYFYYLILDGLMVLSALLMLIFRI